MNRPLHSPTMLADFAELRDSLEAPAEAPRRVGAPELLIGVALALGVLGCGVAIGCGLAVLMGPAAW